MNVIGKVAIIQKRLVNDFNFSGERTFSCLLLPFAIYKL
jgi:hypothetical protein